MKQIFIVLGCVGICLMFATTGIAAEVSQGKCLEFDQTAKKIKLEEYDTNIGPDARFGKPTGIISEFDCSTAKIGILPTTGDILRISFTNENNVKKALRVMNVTRQSLMEK